MKELLMHLSNVLPEDVIVDQIMNHLNDYRSTKNVDSLEMAKVSMTILLCKDTVNAIGSVEKAIDASRLMKQGYDLLNTSKG